MTNPDPIFYNVQDAAEKLGLSRWSTYELVRDGKINAHRKGRRILITPTALLEYAASLPAAQPGPDAA